VNEYVEGSISSENIKIGWISQLIALINKKEKQVLLGKKGGIRVLATS
jgi:hypothetical protein